MNYSYMQALSLAFPGIEAQATSDAYEDIVHVKGQPLPSKAVLDAWIAANPKPEHVMSPVLLDNTPSYGYPPLNGLPISAAAVVATFTTQSIIARNFYLGVAGTDGSFIIPRNAVVTDATVSIQSPVNVPVDVHLRLNGSSTNLLTITIPAGQTSAVVNEQVLLLSQGQALRCYLACSKSVANPIATFLLSWRN